MIRIEQQEKEEAVLAVSFGGPHGVRAVRLGGVTHDVGQIRVGIEGDTLVIEPRHVTTAPVEDEDKARATAAAQLDPDELRRRFALAPKVEQDLVRALRSEPSGTLGRAEAERHIKLSTHEFKAAMRGAGRSRNSIADEFYSRHFSVINGSRQRVYTLTAKGLALPLP